MISVTIPCHNYGRFLADAVGSVLGQSRPADEIVIVDDGSTDDTAAVAAELAADHGHIHVLARTPARGAATTFNDGVRASQGDLVVILSADDRLSPTYLERCESRLRTEPHLDFVYCPAHLFGAEDRVDAAPPFDPHALVRRNFINGSAMFRRAMFDRTGGFRTDLAYEDWEYWLHAVSLGSIGAPVDGAWLEYRKHTAGSRNSLAGREMVRAHRRLRQLHPSLLRRRDLVAWVGRGAAKRVRRAVAPSAR